MPGTNDIAEFARDMGSLSKDVQLLREEMKALQRDMRETQDLLNKVRGGWKAVSVISAAVGGGVSFIVTSAKLKMFGGG